MKFIHISAQDSVGSHNLQSEYFAAACARLDIKYCRYIDTEFNIDEFKEVENFSPDLIYRSGLSKKARAIEILLAKPDTKMVYYNNQTAISGKGSTHVIMKKHGLPVIPSIPFLPERKRDAVAFAEHLGGFPLVIKVSGGQEGIGVMRVDSPESLNSVGDYLKKDPKAQVMVMQYIEHEYYARAVVVGDTVVAATKDRAPEGDFRGNAYGRRSAKGESFTLTEDMKRDVIKATKLVGVKAAGVDLLLTDNGYYLAEVNSPFNFSETQTRTGVDIASAIILGLQK